MQCSEAALHPVASFSLLTSNSQSRSLPPNVTESRPMAKLLTEMLVPAPLTACTSKPSSTRSGSRISASVFFSSQPTSSLSIGCASFQLARSPALHRQRLAVPRARSRRDTSAPSRACNLPRSGADALVTPRLPLHSSRAGLRGGTGGFCVSAGCDSSCRGANEKRGGMKGAELSRVNVVLFLMVGVALAEEEKSSLVATTVRGEEGAEADV
ncbi:hypothetical protein BKA80DRAFT_276750 [Phyllosticta citrichinensis]